MIWLYALLAFAVGAAAGFQGIYQRYEKDSGRAAGTFWGVVYLLSRAIVPAVVFVGLFRSRLDTPFLPLYALGCGVGAEALLRTQFYIKSAKTPEGAFQEIFKGAFDLLRWYQGFFLQSIAGGLAAIRQRTVRRALPEGQNFRGLVAVFDKNATGYPDPPAIADLQGKVRALETEYNAKAAEGQNSNLDEQYRHKLGYIILNAVGRKGLKTLLNP